MGEKMTYITDYNPRTPRSRNTDPLSSYLADKEITQSGTREKQIQQCVNAVKNNQGYTSKELSVLTGIDRYTLGRRLPESAQLKKGRMRKCSITNKSAVTWELND